MTKAETARNQNSPGMIDWGFQLLAVILFATGVYIAFPVPLLAGIYGAFRLKNTDDKARKQWMVFTIIAALLAVMMFVAWLALSPSGGMGQAPTQQTGWQPAQ